MANRMALDSLDCQNSRVMPLLQLPNGVLQHGVTKWLSLSDCATLGTASKELKAIVEASSTAVMAYGCVVVQQQLCLAYTGTCTEYRRFMPTNCPVPGAPCRSYLFCCFLSRMWQRTPPHTQLHALLRPVLSAAAAAVMDCGSTGDQDVYLLSLPAGCLEGPHPMAQ